MGGKSHNSRVVKLHLITFQMSCVQIYESTKVIKYNQIKSCYKEWGWHDIDSEKKMATAILLNTHIAHCCVVICVVVILQEWFKVCTQPMRDGVPL